MIRRLAVAFAISVLFVFSLIGCGEKEASASTARTGNTVTAPPLLNLDIAGLLTPEQVSGALGITVGEALVTDEDTTVRYYSEDTLSYSEISMMECGRDIFDSTAALYTDAADTQNLGQAAKWSAEGKQLLVYSGKYMISVSVSAAGKSDENLLISARQIAALILEKI